MFVTVLSGPDLFVRYPNGDECYIVSAIYATDDVQGELAVDNVETLELRYFALDGLPANIGRTSRRALESHLAQRG